MWEFYDISSLNHQTIVGFDLCLELYSDEVLGSRSHSIADHFTSESLVQPIRFLFTIKHLALDSKHCQMIILVFIKSTESTLTPLK